MGSIDFCKERAIRMQRRHTRTTALILIDRDGVINQNMPQGPTSVSEFKKRMIPDLSGLLKIIKGGFKIAVISNQPDVARKIITAKTLSDMNKIIERDALKAGIGSKNFTIKICPHTGDTCNCRKPKTGLIKQAVKEFGLDPKHTRFYIVGDQFRDIKTLLNYYDEALKPAKISRRQIFPILLRWKYSEYRPHNWKKYMSKGDEKRYTISHKLNSALKLIVKKEKSFRN